MIPREPGSRGASLRRGRGVSTGTFPLAAALVVAALGLSSRAEAYCRTAACPEGVGSRCEPALPTDCGEVLAWKTPCLGYVVQEDGTKLASLERVRELIGLGFAQWTAVDCAGQAPGLGVVDLGTVSCDERGYNQGGANSNLIVFRDEEWPYPARALALTTVTYGIDDARIYDADIEVNTVGIGFTFDDADPKYDFQSIITHEAGHFLGLAHSSVCDVNHDDPDCPNEADVPTMVLSYDRGSIELRTLADDDALAICAVYPPEGGVEACAPTFDGGLADECATSAEPTEDAEEGGCCTVAPGAAPSGRATSTAAVVLAGIAALSLRRRGRTRPRS